MHGSGLHDAHAQRLPRRPAGPASPRQRLGLAGRRPIVRSVWQLLVLVVAPVVFLCLTVFADDATTSHIRPAAWYCAADGRTPPRQLEQRLVGLHQCTDDELHDAGYWSGVV
jgi:hypothetical protein